MNSEFRMTRRVQFAETDLAGVLHFANYFRYMEAAEHAFCRSMGFSVHEENQDRIAGWPRVRVECDFTQPLMFEDEVEVHLLVDQVKSRSIRYVFIFRKLSGGTGGQPPPQVALGAMIVVYAAKEHGDPTFKAEEIPDRIRSQITEAPRELLP